MSRRPNFDFVPMSVVKDQFSKIILSIPDRAGSLTSDMENSTEAARRLKPVIEAVLGAQKEIFEFEKELRREQLLQCSGGQAEAGGQERIGDTQHSL